MTVFDWSKNKNETKKSWIIIVFKVFASCVIKYNKEKLTKTEKWTAFNSLVTNSWLKNKLLSLEKYFINALTIKYIENKTVE